MGEQYPRCRVCNSLIVMSKPGADNICSCCDAPPAAPPPCPNCENLRAALSEALHATRPLEEKCERLERERDQARAEVERLKADGTRSSLLKECSRLHRDNQFLVIEKAAFRGALEAIRWCITPDKQGFIHQGGAQEAYKAVCQALAAQAPVNPPEKDNSGEDRPSAEGQKPTPPTEHGHD